MTNLHHTWHHIRRSPFQSSIAVLVMIICFFVLTAFIVISDGLGSVLSFFETKPEITLFLKDGLDKTAVEAIQQDLSNYPNVKEIKFISKEKALSIYKDINRNNPLLTEAVSSSILPASFEVSVSDPKVLEIIAENYSTRTKEIDEVIYQKDIIQTLMNWINIIRRLGLISVSVFATLAFLIIFVVIGMKITNRKEEIRISRLLGASRFYVQRPFLIEGMLYGLIGGTIGSVTCLLIFFNFGRQINNFFSPVSFLRYNFLFYFSIVAIEILFATLWGVIASWLTAKRYIKF